MREPLTPALEDYLEAVYRIEAEKRVARVRDIAAALDVHKSSVTAALRGLSERKVVNYEPYEAVTLTPGGRKRARRIAARHAVLRHFLEHVLGAGADPADDNARRIAHAVDEEILERFVCFVAFAHEQAGEGWREEFRRFAADAVKRGSCEEKLEKCLDLIGEVLPDASRTET
jgi:DtxR family Mn-dependent transcriptional regulator